MANIFIGLSKHHVEIFENVLLKRDLVKGDKILITNSEFSFNRERWDEIVLLNINPNNDSVTKFDRLKNILFKIKEYSKCVKQLDKFKGDPVLTLYYSSLEDVLSNYLFFYFSKNLKGIVIEDGILNYYRHTTKNVSKLILIFKKIFSILFKINFRIYEGHTSGIDYDKVICQYVRAPELAMNIGKSKKLSLSERNIDELSDNILIIGQEPYANVIGYKNYLNKLNTLFEHVKTSPLYSKAKIIYYKPHRHGPRVSKEYISSKFQNRFTEVVEIEDSIENLYFNNLKTTALFTFDSSAVLNIYLDANTSIKDEIDINVMPFYNQTLLQIFKQLNFNILQS